MLYNQTGGNMIYTGSYSKCKSGNLISISGNHGKTISLKQ